MKSVTVRCIQGGVLLATYEFGYETPIGPAAPPDRAELQAEAQSNLTTEGKAFPPYDGITFEFS